MPGEFRTLLIMLLVLLALCLIVAIFMRIVRFIIIICALIIIIPVLFTVLWGDGETYVSKFASLFSPQMEEEINTGYQFYKETDQQDPVVDLDQIKEYGKNAADSIKNAAGSLFSGREDLGSDSDFQSPNSSGGG